MCEKKDIPEINIVTDLNKDPKWNDWETSSIGSSEDLVGGGEENINEQSVSGIASLGWNLPTNDLSKAGNLDTLSVDSYWVGEEEIDEIEKEKQIDPINPNYKAVYEKLQNKLNFSSEKDKNNKETLENSNNYNKQKVNLPDQKQ